VNDLPATTNSARDDAQLLKESRHDAAAFRAFYDRWSPPVLGYFQRRVNDPQLALDLTAETFAVVFEKSGGFRWRGISPGAWVFGIARRRLQHYFRQQAVERRALEKLGVEPVVYEDAALQRVEQLVDNEALRKLVAAVLESARESDRRVLEMRFIDNLPYADIAQSLGCSVNAARVRCHRALNRIEQQLAEHEAAQGAFT
jgi:RNA polymerase sigma-70 factor (ECF subfamily)